MAQHLIGTRTYKGTSALRVTNPAEGNLCGLKQKGIHLEEGREYRMLFQVGAEGSLSQAGLEGFGTTEHTAEQYPFTITLGSQQHTIGIGTVTKKYYAGGCYRRLAARRGGAAPEGGTARCAFPRRLFCEFL